MKKASLRDLKQPTFNAPRTGSRHKRVLSGSPFHPRAPPPSRDQFLRSSALFSAQVFQAYPKIAALENRTFHLLIKPDILRFLRTFGERDQVQWERWQQSLRRGIEDALF